MEAHVCRTEVLPTHASNEIPQMRAEMKFLVSPTVLDAFSNVLHVEGG